jgi:hypothetical protein
MMRQRLPRTLLLLLCLLVSTGQAISAQLHWHAGAGGSAIHELSQDSSPTAPLHTDGDACPLCKLFSTICALGAAPPVLQWLAVEATRVQIPKESTGPPYALVLSHAWLSRGPPRT